ncbi:MAG: NAD(P)H-binding protein [Chitinispirillia bacterium]|nr:NAD(P)H-binding protein [Chitinispirillia bacterium]
MAARILITGAASVLGAEAVRRFAGARVPVRAASHGVFVDERLSSPLVENVPFDFTDKELVSNALKNIDRVFLLLPLTSEMGEYARIFINQAAISGVSHIVHVSFLSVEKIPMIKIARWHHEAEDYLTESGISYTILRPNIFMQQFTSLFSPSGGLIYLPFGKGAVSYVDARDAALCAQEILMNAQAHAGRIYRITGSQKWNLHKAASLITEVIGSHVMYADVSEETSRDIMLSLGIPAWKADALLELYALIRNGLLDDISRDYEEITDTVPSLFLDFLRDYADVLRGLVEE